MKSAEAKSGSADGAFSISSSRFDGGILVALTGDIDLASASVVDDELRRAEQSEDLVVLDLGDVTFMDSTGLRMVISADRRLRKRGACLRLVHVPRQVTRLFELVGVSELLRIADGADGADGQQPPPDDA
jgi:anti-anti-sigma factor